MNVSYTFIAQEQEELRLDKFLAKKLIGIYSREQIKQIILSDLGVEVNGTRINQCDFKLKFGAKVHIHKHRDLAADTQHHINDTEPYDIKIAYEDEDLFIIDKPAKLPVYPGIATKITLCHILKHKYGHYIPYFNTSEAAGIVHRLDQDTSGLIIIAKHNQSYEALSQSIAKREVQRKYIAIVYGNITPVIGSINVNIGKSKYDYTKMTALKQGGKIAITHYRLLDSNKKISVVECRLETGRTHQIRVHLSFKKHPVLHDSKYSLGYNIHFENSPLCKAIKSLQRHALHAYSLEFYNPLNNKLIQVVSSLPNDMQNIIINMHC